MTEPVQASGKPSGRGRPALPRWVIGFIIAGAVLVVLVVVLLALGHGPQQHLSSGMLASASAGRSR